MPGLSKEDKLRLLKTMLESRHADLREQNLNRQGKGHFHVSGMGHEALAAISIQMGPDDYIVPYYRDRGLVLGRGMTTRELALEYFAKRKTGQRRADDAVALQRRRTSHLERAHPDRLATSSRMRHRLGNQTRRQEEYCRHDGRRRRDPPGRFFRSDLFCKRKETARACSWSKTTLTASAARPAKINPLALEVLQPNEWQQIAGQDVQKVYDAAATAMEKMRAGDGPSFFWVKMERLLQPHQLGRSKTLSQRRRIAGSSRNAIRSNAGKIN